MLRLETKRDREIERKGGEKEIRKNTKKINVTKQRRRATYTVAWIGSDERLSPSLFARGDEFPFSAGTIFIAGNFEPRETRVRSFTRKQRGQSCFPRDAPLIRRRLSRRCAQSWRCHAASKYSDASAIRLRDLPPPPEIRASNYD